TLPIALGVGVGSESRRPLGIAVVGGLAFSQFITLYVTPVIYTYLDALQQRLGRTSLGRAAAGPSGQPVPEAAPADWSVVRHPSSVVRKFPDPSQRAALAVRSSLCTRPVNTLFTSVTPAVICAHPV